MDHLTMGLENLQKQAGGVAAALKPQQTTPAGASNEKPKTLGKILYHQVSAGDTLFSIAKRYNLTIDQLLKINRMDPNSVIKSGQKLIVREGAE
jgi:LysM repeat protein